MQCTLKTNVIARDGTFIPRGSVIDREELPSRLRTNRHIVAGVVKMDKIISPYDEVEIGEELDIEEGEGSPMKELVFPKTRPKFGRR
jgi:hypothetical protein